MKTIHYIILPACMLVLSACATPEIEEGHLENTNALRQSSLCKRGLVPVLFVDILPPSAQDIHYQFSSADTIGHMKFCLAQLPDDYFTLISRMELALESEIMQLQPFEPESASWWDTKRVPATFDTNFYVFRKLPLRVGDAVYIAINESGEVYAWIDQ